MKGILRDMVSMYSQMRETSPVQYRHPHYFAPYTWVLKICGNRGSIRHKDVICKVKSRWTVFRLLLRIIVRGYVQKMPCSLMPDWLGSGALASVAAAYSCPDLRRTMSPFASSPIILFSVQIHFIEQARLQDRSKTPHQVLMVLISGCHISQSRNR